LYWVSRLNCIFDIYYQDIWDIIKAETNELLIDRYEIVDEIITKYFSSKLMNISIIRFISYIRSEIKIPIIIFSGYEYYYLKYFTLKNMHTANTNIDKMVDIY